MGEEPPLLPSGTVFFSSCTFGCVFCQNYDISTNPTSGRNVPSKELASIFISLSGRGAANINLVGGDPTPNILSILKALTYFYENTSILWNSNMYCSVESMELLFDLMDLWLPDFKYGNDRCALRLSGVPDYFEVVSRNHRIAHDRGSGEMIIRHLVLPSHLECCTIPVLDWISENTPKALVNIMQQYRPTHRVPGNLEYSDIDRYPKHEEVRLAYKRAEELGIVWKSVS
jgi:putative pyruvate formate lyase activating enzyme